MFSKFESDGKLNPTYEDGAFELPVATIKAYLKEPVTPRYFLDFGAPFGVLHVK